MLKNFIKLLRKISSWEEKHGQTSKLSEKKNHFSDIFLIHENNLGDSTLLLKAETLRNNINFTKLFD